MTATPARWPTSNAEFLRGVFNPLPAASWPVLCGFVGNPSDRKDKQTNWTGHPWVAGCATDDPARNWYFTLGTYPHDGAGRVHRDKERVATIYGVLVDDIGTRAPLSRLESLPPSVLTMTSASNFQALYLFDQPSTDAAAVQALQSSLIAAGLSDPGADGPASRYARMPFASNRKYSPPQSCYLVEWHPERRYSIDAIMRGLNLSVVAPRTTLALDVPNDGPCAEWRGPESDEALREIAMRSRSAANVFGDGVSFAQLWEADADALGRKWPSSGRAYDASSADMALAQRLAFFTGRDQARIDRMMRASALARDKYERADYLPRTISAACAQQRDVYAAPRLSSIPAAAAETPVESLTFAAASAGWIDAKLENVFDALISAESGVRIALDLFLEAIMLSGSEGKWKPFTDADYGRLRAQFGRRGFKPVSPEIMKTAVLMAAEENKFDSAIQWAEGLQWDGVPRIDTVLPTYYRTADTPYNRAVGAYLFTALAARALQPGAQVDMVPVFVGIQGARKTSAIRVLSPDIRFFSEINLKKIDDENMARRVRGKLVGEIAELRGLAGRDQESVKAWITRREETWRPLFREFETTYPRRLVLIGTANEREFLDDPTGERRWLPVTSGAVDVEALERDCAQLWAEGVHRFKASGVAWRDAEQLARAEHARFKVLDPWAEPVERWLSEPTADEKRARSGKAGFKMEEIFSGALSRNIGTVPMADSKRMGKVLRSLGMERTEGRVNGKTVNLWARVI